MFSVTARPRRARLLRRAHRTSVLRGLRPTRCRPGGGGGSRFRRIRATLRSAMVERLKLRGVGLVVTIAVAALGWLPPVGLAAEARGGSVAAGGDPTVSPEQSA